MSSQCTSNNYEQSNSQSAFECIYINKKTCFESGGVGYGAGYGNHEAGYPVNPYQPNYVMNPVSF